jgi:hypothetical protein
VFPADRLLRRNPDEFPLDDAPFAGVVFVGVNAGVSAFNVGTLAIDGAPYPPPLPIEFVSS